MKSLYLWLAIALSVLSAPAFAQSTVTLTPSITAGDGTLTTNILWSTSPALTTGTPCVAGSTPTNPQWDGAKAGSGSVTGLTFTQNTRITLSCTFPGDSIVTFTVTPPTQNTNGTPYTNPKSTRIKYTFNPTISTAFDPVVGETAIDLPTPQVMRTVTGITQVGTMRAVGFAVNTADMFSAPSAVATKEFRGSFAVNQGVDLTVRSIPNSPVVGLQ